MPRLSQAAQARHLAARDPILGEVIGRVTLPPLGRAGAVRDRGGQGHFATLAVSIISQQISNAAAATIVGRFREMFGGGDPSPEEVRDVSAERLRVAGLSASKAAYVKDLAERVLDGRLDLERVASLSDEELTRELVAVRGIGPWTAEMFMIFSLGREDVFSCGDGGLASAVARLYGLEKPVPRAELLRISAAWAPYRSLASRYLWASLQEPRN